MTRILVFSDSHDTVEHMEKTVENMIGVDYIFHLGDHSKDARYLELIFPEKKHYYVRGNCDFCAPEPIDYTVEIDGFTFYLTHGHEYGVKTRMTELRGYAEKNGIDCVLYGHTHIAECEKIGNVLYLNPGSAKESAGVIEIEEGEIKGCTFKII